MSRGRALLAVLLVVAVLGAVPTPALADARGEPQLDASISEDEVAPGEETTLEVTLSNAADLEQASTTNPALNERVTTARGVTVSLGDRGVPFTVRTGTRSVGSVPDGAAVPVPFTVSVDEDAAPGRYRVPVEVEYTYTSLVEEPNGTTTTETDEERFTVTVVVVDRPRFAVADATTDVAPGGTGTLSLTVENVGEGTARDTSLALASADGALSFGTGGASQYAGTWESGERRTLTYAVSASERAGRGPYPATLTATFSHEGRSVTAPPRTLGVMPRAGSPFVVTNVSRGVTAGGTGTVAIDLRNGGPAARAATVTLRSPNAVLTVDGAAAAERFVGTWEPDETRTVRYDLTAARDAGPYNYTLTAVVDYETAAGTAVTAPPIRLGVSPRPGLAFGVTDVSADLHVGEEGRLRGEVVNRGSRTARNAVVSLVETPQTVVGPEPTYAVGDLAPNERAAFAFPVEVDPHAEAGPRQFAVAVAYEDGEGNRATADPIRLRARVGPRRDRLRATATNATFEVDSSGRLTVDVTNAGNETLRNVNAVLGPSPPLSSEAPTSFVRELEPGETATLAFALTVSDDAVANTHAVGLNVTAERQDGRTVRFAPELVPVEVVEPTGAASDVTTLVVAAVVVVAVLAGGWWWLRR